MNNIKYYTISILISFLVTLIGISLASIIFAYTNINDRHLQTFVFGIMVLSVLTGATILARKLKQKGLVYGGIFGLLYCLLIYVTSSIAYTGIFFSNTLLIYLFICFLSGVVGGIIGVNI